MAPGNAGTAGIAQNVDISPANIEEMVKFAQKNGIGLVAIGPEAPLAEGIVDRFQATGIPVFGPTKGATQIESSKAFSKELMQKHGIPLKQLHSYDYGGPYAGFKGAINFNKEIDRMVNSRVWQYMRAPWQKHPELSATYAWE